MKSGTRVFLFTAAVVASLTAGAIAAPYRDCSKLKKWNFDRVYKRGDVVWYRDGGMNYGAEYKCEKDTCHKGEPTLSSGRDMWKNLGSCEKRPPGVSTDVLRDGLDSIARSSTAPE